MWYGVLVGLSGSLAGIVAAFFYRSKVADAAAEIVGLKADVRALNAVLARRDEDIAHASDALVVMRKDAVSEQARLNKLLEDTREALKTARTTLVKLRSADPDGVAIALGELFPVHTDGSQDSRGREASGGSGTP